MNKDEIIKNLYTQNQSLQEQVNFWKSKYINIEREYKELLNRFTSKQLASNFHKQKIVASKQESIQEALIQQKQPTSQAKKQYSPQHIQQNIPIAADKMTDNKPRQQDMFDFFSQNVFKSIAVPHSACELIEGCFIIEKISSIDHFDPLRFIYPPNKFEKLKNMFDIIYRFIFINEAIPEIQDDQFDSRKNQINFGTPCEDFQFVFDNIDDRNGEKNRLNQFQRVSHLMRKRYIYGVIRPEIIKIDKKLYETELAYGFISNVPFPNFFRDLNRIVQQQIKFRMLSINKDTVNKKEKVDIVSEIIKDITAKSIQKKLDVTSYPINLQLNAKICGLRLVYSTKSNFVSDQFNYIEGFTPRYSKLKLVKILHYVLTEQHIIILCKSRKNLNQLFEVIRSFIYPFNWVFPIIYYYSSFFEPFLSSPLPIIIGFIENDSKIQEEDKDSKQIQIGKQLPVNDFITIYAQQQQKQDLNELSAFESRISSLYKLISKQKKISSPSKSQKMLSPLLQMEDRITYKFYNYIRKLRDFIETGNINQEVDDFLIQFMQTQMVSYYKQNLISQAVQK